MANPSQTTAPSNSDKAARLEALKRQFDGTPYPWVPLEKKIEEDIAKFYEHSMVTAFYQRDFRVVDTQGMSILDVGCGSGYKALALAHVNPGTTVVGVDLSPRSVELAKKRAEHWGLTDRLQFHVMDLDNVGRLGRKFDYINFDEVLYLCTDPAASLKAVTNMLKPEGILRVNLHDYYQRMRFLNSQKASQMLDPDSLSNSEEAINNFLELVEYLAPNTFIKQSWGNYAGASREQKVEVIQANFLLQGDNGFTIDNSFSLMEQAGVHWCGMVAPQRWDWKKIFVTDKPLPERLQSVMNRMSDKQKLELVDWLMPDNRLIDFRCSPTPPAKRSPVVNWSMEQWKSATIHCHPMLQTGNFYEDMVKAAQEWRGFGPKPYFPTPQSVTGIGAPLLPVLMPLKEGPQSLDALVDRLAQVHPLNPLTQEPVDREHLAGTAVRLLNVLEACGYIFVCSEQMMSVNQPYNDPWRDNGVASEANKATSSNYFEKLLGRRAGDFADHKLLGTVGLAACAVTSGADDWADIQGYGEAKEQWLKSFLGLNEGIPTDGLIKRLFASLDPDQFQESCSDWLKQGIQFEQGENVLSTASVWMARNRLVFGQMAIAAGSTELTALPKLLEVLSLAGNVVTIDGATVQESTAKAIIDGGGDYILSTKNETAGSYQEVAKLFASVNQAEFQNVPHEFHQTVSSSRSRVDIRRHWLVDGTQYMAKENLWQGLKQIGMVETECRLPGRDPIFERRFYLLSTEDGVEEFAKAVRSHWELDNQPHWLLDVAPASGASSNDNQNASANLTCIRDVAFNRLKDDDSIPGEIEAKRRRAGWDNDYVSRLLGS
ncbi:MAG: ISAs1 family transposase [Cyanobacteria bacterium P01_D01_bin.73]